MAADHREIVERGLRAKKTGNRLIEVIGGRAVHPDSPRRSEEPGDAEAGPMGGRGGALEDERDPPQRAVQDHL
ncbi:MAG: hypothetical protein F9K44_16530 [Hyphomicrobiaceae bacterium]|nr:MAG: hypothetical protein F9K44_16530 [Hyphomicrobiaceae bacterium]